jgi:hypothetical protein
MISRSDFLAIDAEIKEAIDKTLNELRTINQSHYVLFLADGEYHKELEDNNSGLNPNVIGNMMDRYKDSSRFKFLAQFLNAVYSFTDTKDSTDDNEYMLHLELMVYTHIWEAKPFLKKLYRLAHLWNGEQYAWDVQIPDKSKHKFIRDEIRKIFEDKKSPLFQIIKNGFHTSLRNAFAHSEYHFDTMNGRGRIILDKKNKESWELKEISFDDWSRRFVYSALLSYYLFDLTYKHSASIIESTGNDRFLIKLPTKINDFNLVWIKYDKPIDRFIFEVNADI